MAPADPFMALLFITFLVLFLVIGILPALQRTARALRGKFRSQFQRLQPGAGTVEEGVPTPFGESGSILHLTEFDLFILQQLAQAGAQGRSRKQLQAALQFSPGLVRTTLGSLLECDLVQITMPLGFATHYVLSPRGHAFAVAQGYLPQFHQV